MFRSLRYLRVIPTLVAGLCASLSAQAAIFTVGPVAEGCTHTSIAAAIATAEASPLGDTIRLTRRFTYTAQAIVIATAQDLNVVGGFATCTSTVSDGQQTVLDGSAGAAAPVLRVTANLPGTAIKLRLLRIIGGDSTGDGGGIRFNGQGELELIETTISNNVADAGGGIHVRGSAATTKLVIGNDNLIAGNQARSGGGIYLEQAEMLMQAPGSSIFANEATETGGGLRLYDNVDGAGTTATISSTGYLTLAAIEGNTAQVGGGVALFGSTRLLLEGASMSAPAVLRENFASQRGGAIDLQPVEGQGFLLATLRSAVLEGNAAPTGAAVFAGNDSSLGNTDGSGLSITDSRIVGQVSENVSSVPTDGPIVVVTEESRLDVERSVLSGNRGGPVVRAGNAAAISIFDSLLSDNTVRGGVLSLDGQIPGACRVLGSTIAGNTIETGPVVFVAQDFTLENSVIWQPGVTSLQAGSRFVRDVLASEIGSLGNSASIISAEPRFMDPAAGDYRLQAASPAIDRGASAVGDGLDLDGAPRGVDLPRVANGLGAFDLGAYERQTLGNLALNPQFLTDRRLWDAGIPGSTATWGATGAANGGSVGLSMIAAPGGSFVGLRQCVRIPGPGRYRLTGLAYGSGADFLTRDDVSLRWSLRHNTGNETCTGTIDAQGSVEFNNTATWGAPPTPGVIDVPAAQFSRFTNVEVLLQVREGSLNVNATTLGYFDEIALVADDSAPGDAVFANGFEP